MRDLAHLLDRLSLTKAPKVKQTLVREFMRRTPDPDRGWVLAVLTGALGFRAVRLAAIRETAEARMDSALFAWSRDYVGDLAETIALVWPSRPGANREPDISDVVQALPQASPEHAKVLVEGWLDALDADGRWALLKLVTGGPRAHISPGLARQALADFGGVAVAEIEELWHAQEPPYGPFLTWLEGRGARPAAPAAGHFRPVMLANALDVGADLSVSDPADFAVEWKWDGVRVQAVAEDGVRRLYTRGGDDISAAFPDVLEAMTFEGVIDGELLIMRPGGIAPYSDLGRRLGRKTADTRLIARSPAGVRAYDMLADHGEDLRDLPFRQRRARLETMIAGHGSPRLDLSPIRSVETWEQLKALRAAPPPGDAGLAEGLMLKRWDSPYVAGRPGGPWFKWKRDPMILDAVLMYARRGADIRSSLHSDVTFGLWRAAPGEDRALVAVGKADVGLNDAEMKAVDVFVRENTLERFGPARSVRAGEAGGLVLEVAFETVQRSTRHKSGLALRAARINRIRWDKPAREADDLATLERLVR